MGQCSGHERTDFEQCLLWKGIKVGVVVLKELILRWFLPVGGCGVLERIDFEQFPHWEGLEVMKELILNSFYFGRV